MKKLIDKFIFYFRNFNTKCLGIFSSCNLVSRENEANTQPTKDMTSNLNIWLDKVGWKKGKMFGLSSISNILIASLSKPTMFYANPKEIDALRSPRQVQEK